MKRQDISARFYANYGFVTPPESNRLQGAFGALKGIFYHVRPQTNKGKTVSMSCRPCHIPQVWSIEAYTWRVTGMGISFLERLRQRLHCLEYGLGLVARSLTVYCQ